jgi:hypothetical protein
MSKGKTTSRNLSGYTDEEFKEALIEVLKEPEIIELIGKQYTLMYGSA